MLDLECDNFSILGALQFETGPAIQQILTHVRGNYSPAVQLTEIGCKILIGHMVLHPFVKIVGLEPAAQRDGGCSSDILLMVCLFSVPRGLL